MSQRHHITPNTSSQPSGGPSAALLGHAPGQSSFQPSATQYMHLYAHDHPPSPSSNSTKQQPVVAVAAPRTSSLPLAVQMGHSQSKPAPPLPSSVANNGSPTSTLNPASSAATKGLNAAVAGGMKLKRAFAGRRKKSEDASTLFVNPSEQELKQRTMDQSPRPADTWTPQRIEVGSSSAPQFFNKPLVTSPPSSIPSPPPPPPPKKELPPPAASTLPPPDISLSVRNSVIPLSPGISSAVNYMMLEQQQQTAIKQVEGDKREMKESWRKSDSTNSHHTIRPAAGVSSSRSSRPVSWAESFQSAHTVVQVSGNKRRSALLGDADFGMPEEDDDDDVDNSSSSFSSHPHLQNAASTSSPSLPSPEPARVIKKRRSVSLVGVASTSSQKTSVPVPAPPPSASATELKYPSYSISEGVPPPPRYPTAPVPRLPPMMSPSVSQPQPPTQLTTSMASATVASLKGKFAAWSSGGTHSTTTISPPISVNFTPRRDQTLPSLPQHNLAPIPSPTTPSSRQPAISGIGPAAAGLAKRAVEKMGRKWGLSSSTSGSGSGYSSSSSTSNSTNAPSSWTSSPHTDYAMIRDSAGNHSTPSLGSSFGIGGTTGFMSGPPGKGVGVHKRTPNAPSGAGSISSNLTSGSESDPFAPVGPVLGKQLRGGLRSKNGVQVNGGIVFSRDLRSVVRETGIKVGKPPSANSTPKEGLVGELEERMLPALVVRCAQHLLLWGVQEEGLFRVNGRPSHVSKLRAEFDSGADFDMADCSPGDLDPHAVSSVFKAFLRTLPEPILTHKLQPLFDAAVSKETALNAPPQSGSPNRMSLRPIPGLPSGPKAGGGMAIRKPPSLSTLAMPSFNGIPPPSKSLVTAVRSLIAQLPQENRDLIRTVADLINATAKHSKETKMPLSNLLLVFCPSLNMSPPLLKVLCEAEGIWSNEEDSPVIDIRRHTPNLNSGGTAEVPPPTPTKDGVDPSASSGKEVVDETSSVSDTMSAMEPDEEDSLRSERPSFDNPSSDYHASAEDDGSSMYDERDEAHRRRLQGERPEVPTLYLSTRSHCSSSSASSLLQDIPTSKYDGAFVRHLRDTATDNGSISSGPYSMNNPHPSSSPPLLSSSAESITTPTTSSNPSFSNLHLDGGEKAQLEPQHQHEGLHSVPSGDAPQIAEPVPLELRSQGNKSRPVISGPMPNIVPVQFPSDAPLPRMPPAVPTTPSKRRSIPILSLPNFSPPTSAHEHDPALAEVSGTGVNIERTLRAKKPSLKLLFSKRSASSLNTSESRDRDRLGSMPSILPSMVHSAPRSASDSSISTPISAVTAPQSTLSGSSSTSNLPPVLDTPIEDGSLKMDLGLGFEANSSTAVSNGKRASAARGGQGNVSTEATRQQTATVGPYAPPALPTSLSQDSRRSASSQPAPVDSRSVPKPPEKPIPLQPSLSSLSLSSTTSHRLSLFDDDGDEDWTQSVLTAADMANQRPKS